MQRLQYILQRFWNQSPKANLAWIKTRFGSAPPAQPIELLRGKHRFWERFFWQMVRNDALLQNTLGVPFDFAGKRVLEIGPGPLLGYAPLAIAYGVQEYAVIEIDYQDIRQDDALFQNYYKPLYQALSGAGLYAGSLATFREALDAVQIYTQPIEQQRPDRQFDLVTSNAVFEHVADIDATAREMAAITAPGGVHIHLVDYSNHISNVPGTRLRQKYHVPRQQHPSYRVRSGEHLNLLPPSQMVADFRAHFAEVHFVPTLQDDAPPPDVHASLAHLGADDLRTVNGVIIAR